MIDYKRTKKNDIKKWLLGGNAKIYGLILIVLLAAILFMFRTVNSMFANAPADDEDEAVTTEETTTAYVEENQSYQIRVNKTNNFITILKLNSDGEFEAYKVFRCSVNSSVTTGDTTISEKSIWRKLSDGSYGHYASKLDDSGVISSVPYYAQDISQMNTSAYNNLGNTGSYGYICLTSADAQWIYENCGNKTVVTIYEDAEEQPPLEMAEFQKVSSGYTYDPTDTNSPVNSNTSVTKVDFMRGVNDCSVAMNTAFDQWDGIYAQDINGNDITSKITITGSVDITTPGTYTLVYYLSDNFGTNLAYYRYVTVTGEETVEETTAAVTTESESPSTQSSATESTTEATTESVTQFNSGTNADSNTSSESLTENNNEIN